MNSRFVDCLAIRPFTFDNMTWPYIFPKSWFRLKETYIEEEGVEASVKTGQGSQLLSHSRTLVVVLLTDL